MLPHVGKYSPFNSEAYVIELQFYSMFIHINVVNLFRLCWIILALVG